MATTVIALLFHAANPLNAQDMKKEKIPQNLSAFPVGNAQRAVCKIFYRPMMQPMPKLRPKAENSRPTHPLTALL